MTMGVVLSAPGSKLVQIGHTWRYLREDELLNLPADKAGLVNDDGSLEGSERVGLGCVRALVHVELHVLQHREVRRTVVRGYRLTSSGMAEMKNVKVDEDGCGRKVVLSSFGV